METDIKEKVLTIEMNSSQVEVLLHFIIKKSREKLASTGTALFGSNIGTSSKNLVEFRAGKTEPRVQLRM